LKQLFSILLLLHRGTQKHSEWVLACLEGAWPNLVGDRLAAVCRPARFEDSELIVEILDRDWEGAVKNIKPVLLEKLRAATSEEIKTLSFRKRPAVDS
jgi:hypothetical protein